MIIVILEPQYLWLGTDFFDLKKFKSRLLGLKLICLDKVKTTCTPFQGLLNKHNFVFYPYTLRGLRSKAIIIIIVILVFTLRTLQKMKISETSKPD